MRLPRPGHLAIRLLLATLSAILLNEAFPVAGPLPPLRGALSMVALVPLLCAVLHSSAALRRRRLLEAALVGYACGVLWYGLDCYWIYATMHIYGGLPPFSFSSAWCWASTSHCSPAL
jgi:apolipoprotein N-acyltransferase